MKNLIYFLFMVASVQLVAQQLSRPASFGLVPMDINGPLEKELGLKAGSGAFVQEVQEDGTASVLGILVGDVIAEVNGQQVGSAQLLYGLSPDLVVGDRISITVIREGKTKKLKGEVLPKPVYKPEGTEMELGEISYTGGTLRYSMQKPVGQGPFPLVFYIQGYTCGSVIDVPSYHPYARTANSFVEKGYAVLKVEKPGVGDSQTERTCEEITFPEELEAFRVAMQVVNQYDFINTDQITLFGHSLGGLIAPILAAENPAVHNLVLYGVGYQSWRDYTKLRIRHQLPMLGYDYQVIGEFEPLIDKVLFQFFNEKKTPEEIISTNPEAEKVLQVGLGFDGDELMMGRHYTFWQTLNDEVFETYFKKINARVLGVFGESDIAALSGDEMQRAIRIVNTYHPGKGTYWSIAETNHHILSIDLATNLQVQLSPQYPQYLRDNYNEALIAKIDEWLHAE